MSETKQETLEEAVREAHDSCPATECDRQGGDHSLCVEHHDKIDAIAPLARLEQADIAFLAATRDMNIVADNLRKERDRLRAEVNRGR